MPVYLNPRLTSWATLCRPSGACSLYSTTIPIPTTHVVGYFISPLRGFSLLRVELAPGVEIIEIQYGVEDQEVASLCFAAPYRIVREQYHVPAAYGHVDDRRVLRNLASAVEQS